MIRYGLWLVMFVLACVTAVQGVQNDWLLHIAAAFVMMFFLAVIEDAREARRQKFELERQRILAEFDAANRAVALGATVPRGST